MPAINNGKIAGQYLAGIAKKAQLSMFTVR
jgi:hypothetical protein